MDVYRELERGDDEPVHMNKAQLDFWKKFCGLRSLDPTQTMMEVMKVVRGRDAFDESIKLLSVNSGLDLEYIVSEEKRQGQSFLNQYIAREGEQFDDPKITYILKNLSTEKVLEKMGRVAYERRFIKTLYKFVGLIARESIKYQLESESLENLNSIGIDTSELGRQHLLESIQSLEKRRKVPSFLVAIADDARDDGGKVVLISETNPGMDETTIQKSLSKVGLGIKQDKLRVVYVGVKMDTRRHNMQIPFFRGQLTAALQKMGLVLDKNIESALRTVLKNDSLMERLKIEGNLDGVQQDEEE